jgi:hypothetical protein
MKSLSFTTTIGILKHLKGMHYLEIPKQVVTKIGGIGAKRLLCNVNQQLTYPAGLVALGEGKAYITISTKRMKELGVAKDDEVTVTLTEDKSEYGTDMPEELAELLKQDMEGKHRFDLLPPSVKRYVLNYVATVKSQQLRIERAFLLISNLKQIPLGKENFRRMLGKD